jgi:hypothetical protein
MDSMGSAFLSEASSATTHDFSLADKLGTEFGTVECEINVEVNSVKCSLRSIHALEILLQVLPRQIGRESDDFLYACRAY